MFYTASFYILTNGFAGIIFNLQKQRYVTVIEIVVLSEKE